MCLIHLFVAVPQLNPADVFGEVVGLGKEIGAGDGAGIREAAQFVSEERFTSAEIEEVALEL